MHSWGLYNGRYGMSDKVLLDGLADENRRMADTMLDGEIARQEELKSQLASDPKTAPWIDEARLFQNYKQLQLFDTMTLYFNCVHAGGAARHLLRTSQTARCKTGPLKSMKLMRPCTQ
jgi:hypothetical protein